MALTKVTGDFIKAGSITQGHLHSSHGITTSHIAEGDKLFFTNARVDSRVGSLSTSNLSEGTNLYYTDARARAAISGTGSLSYNSTTGVMSFTMPAQNTSNITEGSNLYYTDARADARVALIVDSAPGTLNTLNELAAALGDDANFSTTVTNSIATKLPLAGGTLTGALQAQPWLFRSMANQTEYHVLDNGSLNGPSWKFRYDGSTANRYVDFGYKDGNGNYTSGLKLYNNQTVSWRGTDIINASGQWTGGIASSGYNNSNWNTAYTYSQVGHLPLAGGTLTGDITINSSGLASSPLIRLNNSESSSYNHAIEAINANLTAGESEIIVIGKETNTKNAGYIGYNWAADASNNNYVTIGQWGENHIFRVYGDVVTSQVSFRGSADVRGTIFYDIDNTAYYLNPASRSQFGSLDLNAGTVWGATTQGTGKGALHLDPNSGTDHAGGAITWGASDASNGTNGQAGIYVRSDGTYGTRMYLSTTDSYATGSKTTIRLEAAGGLYVDRGNFYAPIFYDSNNTSYFLNPSASGGNALKTIGDWRQTTDSWSGEVGGKMQYHGNHWYLQASGYVHFRNASGTNTFYVDQNGVGYVEEYIAGGASMRAPLFYDSANTNYYVDPAGTSRLYHAETTNGSEFIHCKHSGSDFASGTLVTTDIPANTTNGASYVIEVTGKSYSGEPPFAFKAQGYLYNNTIINHSGVSYGKHLTSTNQIKVFNHSDNKLAFWWPRISYWNSFEVRVRDAGGSGRNRALTVVNSTEPSSSKKVTTTLSQAALLGHNYGSGSLYSDRLYDQNDTGFYLDPASQSRLGSLKLDGIISGAASGCAEYGRNHAYHTSELKGYGAEFMIGAQHTEININYRTCNNGASGHTPTTWKWRAGTSSNWSDHYMGLIQSSSSMRAPLFYDSNDTTYYVNPASSSRMQQIDISSAGATGLNITSTDIRSSASSTWTGNPGGAGKIQYHSNRWYIVADSSSNRVVQFRRDGSDVSYIDNSGRLIGAPDARTPIYYDSNDTGYYGDFASTSYLKDIHLKGKITFPTSNGATYSRGSQSYGIYQESGSWSSPFPDLNIGFHTGISMGAYASYNGIRFFDNSDMATQVMSINNHADGVGSNNVYVNNSLQAESSLRAPIFYEASNTNYHIDPASTSLSGKLRSYLIFNDYGAGVVGSYASTRYQLVFAMGNSYKGALDGTNVTGGYGLWYSHPNAGGVAANLSSHGLMNIVNGAWTASLDASTRCSVDMRAPLFYDLNNTGYFADPAGTGYYNKIWCRGSATNSAPRWDTSFHVAQSQHFYAHSSTQTMYVGENNTINIRSTGIASSSLRAPIFYDSSNTGYYTRPATSSYINTLHTAGQIQVGSSGSSQLYLGNTSGNYFRFHTNNSDTYFDANVGDIYWRQGSSTRYIFHMNNATMTVYGTITQHSDIRLKENIITIDSALDKVKKLRGVYYNRKDISLGKQIGLIAQEVEDVVPEVVKTIDDDLKTKSIAYAQLNALLVEAIKEQQTIIDDLKSRLETLENQ